MQDTITYKSLIKLSLLKTKRSNAKSAVKGLIAESLGLWIPSIIFFICIKKEGLEFPTIASLIICICAIFIDFVAKLIFVPDNTVMDAFLKTRPITKEMWYRFISISQFWKVNNLRMPLMLLLFCVLLMPIGIGICALIVLYLVSVLNGYLVMLIKRRSTYQSETAVSAGRIKNVHSITRHNIFKLQTRSFFRSKRLRNTGIFMGIVIYLCGIYAKLSPAFAIVFIFNIIWLLPFSTLQYGFGFESNFFNAIWTKPFVIRRLLSDKYWFNTILRAIGSILCLPLCYLTDLQVLSIVAYFLFIAGIGGLILLYDPYKCVPFDLFGKTYNNNQGTQSARKYSTLLGYLGIMGICYVATNYFLPVITSQILLSALGILGFCIHKPYFRWVENRFLKNRYKYMEKYTAA